MPSRSQEVAFFVAFPQLCLPWSLGSTFNQFFNELADRRYAKTLADRVRFTIDVSMTRREQELLDKQLRSLSPSPRNDGLMIFAIGAAFVVGISLGGAFLAHGRDPPQIVSNDAMAEIVFRPK